MDALLEVVRRTWGYSDLRPLQREAMRASIEGRDALVVLPTGGGKSLCYQALGLPWEAPRAAPARDSPQRELEFDQEGMRETA